MCRAVAVPPEEWDTPGSSGPDSYLRPRHATPAARRTGVPRHRRYVHLGAGSSGRQAALDGAGLAWVAEDRIAHHLETGALVRVLEDWCSPFPGFFLYYPSRRQQPAALSALIDTVRLESEPA